MDEYIRMREAEVEVLRDRCSELQALPWKPLAR